jgi:hypothetical protein
LQCCDGGDYNCTDASGDDRGDDCDDGVKMLIVKVLSLRAVMEVMMVQMIVTMVIKIGVDGG